MRVGQLVSIAVLLSVTAAGGDDFQREGGGSARQLKNALEHKAPPALEVKNWLNVEGKGLSLEDLKGKVVILDFWGTWCPPCRAAMPHLRELHLKHKDEGLVIIGVHTTRGGEKMDDFVKEQGIDWPVAVDVDGKTVKAFQVDSFPDYYLIDRQGILRVADLVNGDLDRVVKVLLKEPADIAAPKGN